MGLELELSSELAALRPIRVTPAARPDDADAAGSGDVGVPSEESGSATNSSVDGAGEIVDDGAGAASAESSGGCVTPTSAASALPAATACPPAPRKPRPAKRMTAKRCCCGGGRPRRSPFFFPVPHDLAAVFVARAPVAAASPACPPPAKKIRVHAVG